jgi:hypothetical protein
MVEVLVWIVDERENKYNWFTGPASECPPVPRLGDFVVCGAGIGAVQSVEHRGEENQSIGGSGPDELHKRYAIQIRAQTKSAA